MGQDGAADDWRRTGLALGVFLYAAAAAALAPDALLSALLAYSPLSLPFLALVALLLAVRAARAGSRAAAAAVLREGCGRAVVAACLLWLGLSAFTTLKLAIPSLVPFFLDGALADLDQWLHGGAPGEALHRWLPRAAAAPLHAAYLPLWIAATLALTVVGCLHPDEALRLRLFWTLLLSVVLLGTVAATGMSSVGPILVGAIEGDDRFAGLLRELDTTPEGRQMRALAGQLQANLEIGGNGLGSGISAMPSMHLAMATLMALTLAAMDRRLAPVGAAWVAVIQVGSVYWGWHYAVDGYASMLGVAGLWWATGGALAPRGLAAVGARGLQVAGGK